MANMDPEQMKHSQLPTAHIGVVEHGRMLEPHELATASANIIKFSAGEPITGNERLVEGWQLATHDALIPQLLNRDGLDELFTRYRPKNAGVMLLDLEGFGEFNENYGQKAGDDVLKSIGQTFLTRLRLPGQQKEVNKDRRHTKALDLVARNQGRDIAAARYGGDEFIAVINLDEVDREDWAKLMLVIQLRLNAFGSYKVNDNDSFPIRMHSVYTISSDPSDTISSLYERLSEALPGEKQARRGTKNK